MDTSEMRDLLRGYLNELDWSNGVTKDDIMAKVTERDDDLRTMVDEYIAEGTYPSVDEVLFLIPDQAWQSSQGDTWRGPETQYVENVETGFDQSPVNQETPQSAAAATGKQTGRATGTTAGQSGSGAGNAGGNSTSGTSARGGMPGDGAGRTENPGAQHAGVWPASGPLPDDPNARYQGMASFGQGKRGAADYEDSGRSEAQTMPSKDASGDDKQTGKRSGQAQQHVGAPGSNAGEVDPAISGSGETTGKQPPNTGGAGFGNAAGGGSQGDAADTADQPRATGKTPRH